MKVRVQNGAGTFSSPASMVSPGETLRESHCKEVSVPLLLSLPFWLEVGMTDPWHHGPLKLPGVSSGSATDQGCAPGKVTSLAKV